ncbi:MAG: NAD(P)-dependent oxidoreductase [Phycisphaerae bacterium]|nr:NAD(P)-dependent oxidoreductase [Phycisphaerae bacterium]
MAETIAFIGLGIMGAPMAGHLLSHGMDLIVHSRSRQKAAALESRGARWADSPAQAASLAQVVCLCVPDTPDVERVLVGDDGVVHSARPGTVVIDHSTISPMATERLARELAAKGVSLLDAPLSGGDVGAREGTLSIMVGGERDDLERVRHILQCYGRTITHCGGPGAGQFTKLVNQILVSINLAAACEALNFARAVGLDLEKTISALAGGAAASWQLLNLGPKIVRQDYRPGFMVDLLLKDLRILFEAAEAKGLSLPLSELARSLFIKASALGHGRNGTQAVYEAVKATAYSDRKTGSA